VLTGREALLKFLEDIEILRKDLSREATAAYRDIRQVSETLAELQETKTVEEFKELFSPEHFKTVQEEIDEVNREFKHISDLANNNESIKFLQETDDLTVAITLQTDLLEELRPLIVQGIKDTLNHHYFLLHKESNKKVTKRLESEAIEMKELGKMEQDSLQKIISLLEYYNITNVLTSSPKKIMQNDTVVELCFSDVLDQKSLTDLILCANNVMRATNCGILMEKLHTIPVGLEKKFQDYACYQWSLIWGHSLLPSNELKNMMECKSIPAGGLKTLQAVAKEKSAATGKNLQEVLSPAIQTCQENVGRLKNKLTQQRQAAADVLKKLQENLDKLNANVSALAKENEILLQLFSELEVLLVQASKLSSYDAEKNREIGLSIKEKNRAVQTQRDKVDEAKQSANESMKPLGIFAKEKDDELYRGTRYLSIKHQYTQIYPLYNDALIKANQYLERSNNQSNTPLKNFVRLVAEYQERKQELASSPELQSNMKPLEDKFKRVETSYFALEKLLDSARKEKAAADEICEKVKEDSWLVYLEELLAETNKHRDQLVLLSREFETARGETAKSLESLYEEKVSLATKDSKNYQEFVRKLDRLRDPLLSDSSKTFEPSEKVENLKQRIAAKKSQMAERLLMIFKVVLSNENVLAVWYPYVLCAANKKSVVDGSIATIDGINYKIPRGICSSRKELKDEDPAKVVKQICLEMRKRLEDGDNQDAPTTAFYTVASDCLQGNDLCITEDKLEYITDIVLKADIFKSLKGTEVFHSRTQSSLLVPT
jgi:hypothetical protein